MAQQSLQLEFVLNKGDHIVNRLHLFIQQRLHAFLGNGESILILKLGKNHRKFRQGKAQVVAQVGVEGDLGRVEPDVLTAQGLDALENLLFLVFWCDWHVSVFPTSLFFLAPLSSRAA